MSPDDPRDEQPTTAIARRLRDEVREAAQREADQIIGKARQDIRTIVSDAYAELLVLRAQVQAISDQKTDRALLSAPLESLEAEAEELRRTLGHTGVAESPEAPSPRETAPERRAQHLPAPSFGMPPPANESRAEDLDFSVAPKRRVRGPVLVVAAVIVAAAAVGIFWAWQRSVTPASTVTSTTPPPEVAPTTSDAPPAATPSATPAAPPASAAAPVPTPAGMVTVRLQARRLVWVRSDVDGQVDAGRIFEEGQVATLGPARSIALRVGDAGALDVSVNGAPAQTLGADGVVVDRRFGEPAPEPVEPAVPGTAPGPPADAN